MALGVSPVRAGMIENNYNDYGHAVNWYDGANNTPGPYCVATSLANSFAFLQNMYPKILMPSLGCSSSRTTASRRIRPATFETVWDSKINYLESKAPGNYYGGGGKSVSVLFSEFAFSGISNTCQFFPRKDTGFPRFREGTHRKPACRWFTANDDLINPRV